MQLLGDEGELGNVLFHAVLVQILHGGEAQGGFLERVNFEGLRAVVEEVLDSRGERRGVGGRRGGGR